MNKPVLRIAGIVELVLGSLAAALGIFYLGAFFLIDRGRYDDSLAGVGGIVYLGLGIGFILAGLALVRMQKIWLLAHVPILLWFAFLWKEGLI